MSREKRRRFCILVEDGEWASSGEENNGEHYPTIVLHMSGFHPRVKRVEQFKLCFSEEGI